MPARSHARRGPARREPITRNRILDAAIELADREGIEAITMRRLGQHLGVEAMSLYKHIRDKDEVLAGIADRVAGEFALPTQGSRLARGPFGTARSPPMRCCSVTRGPVRSWSRCSIPVRHGSPTSTPSSASSVARGSPCRTSHMPLGRSIATYTASRCRSSRWPFDAEDMAAVAEAMAAELDGERYPHLIAMASMAATRRGGIPIDFTFGLDLILDGLERRLQSSR